MDGQVCEFRTLINDLDGSYKTPFENYIKINHILNIKKNNLQFLTTEIL